MGNKEVQDWIDKLIGEGFTAAHPNDGWVDREENKIHLVYPHFNLGLGVGDKLMLGWPNHKERPVRIIGIQEGLLDYFLFEDISTK